MKKSLTKCKDNMKISTEEDKSFTDNSRYNDHPT